MSRQNKVNPAHYTQRGRLTPDDAARELARQRSIGSQHTWQPVKRNALPGRPFKNEDADWSAETSEDAERPAASAARGKAKPLERTAKKISTAGRGRAPRSERGATSSSNAKTGKAARPAARTTATRSTRKAVLARNVGGPALKPLRASKRRKR